MGLLPKGLSRLVILYSYFIMLDWGSNVLKKIVMWKKKKEVKACGA